MWQLNVARQLVHDAGAEQTVQQCVAPLLTYARRAIADGGDDDATLLASLRLILAAAPDKEQLSLLGPFLAPQYAPAVQKGAVLLAMTLHDPGVVDALVAAWPGLSKAAREQAFEAIVARKENAARMLELVGSGELAASTLETVHRQRFVNHPDATIRALSAKAFAAAVNANRAAIIDDYLAKIGGLTAIDRAGDPVRGKHLFAKHCSACHLLEGIGHGVGPDLSALSTTTPRALVESILDPNRVVDDRFRSYTALTVNGLVYTGILTAETSNSVTLVDQRAQQRVLLRIDLESLSMSQQSLMPEGLEQLLSPAGLNDVLAYLAALRQPPHAQKANSQFSGLDANAQLVVARPVGTPDGSPNESTDKWSVELPRIPPTEPLDAQRRLTLQPDVQFELVANEPQVVDPVAMAFDECGAMYVVEMRGYSEQGDENLGRVRRLTDEDGDGCFENSSVFIDGLSWPTAVCCFNGGIYVGAAPDVLFFRDSDSDGVADQREVIFTGLGRSNVQGLVNSFQWGLDNRIYVAVSSSGAEFRHVAAPAGGVLKLQGRDFSFDPHTQIAQPTTGGGQHGMSFNRWGDRFVCSNSDHLQAIVFEERYLAKNPFQAVPGARRSIAVDGPQAEVFRTSQVEAWRVLRTRMRVSGVTPGMIEGGGRAAGYFTSATGVTVDEGGLGEQDRVLVADVGSNLIHRKRLIADGVTYRGERMDPNGELIASSDNWFRPVQMGIGPDGAIYVADMYREVIEHPQSLPPQIKDQLDLTSGRDRGRIYRISPVGYKYRSPRSLTNVTADELVQELEHPNMWRRLTAARLLYESQDKSIVPRLRTRFAESTNPVGKLSMLYTLAGLNSLEDDQLLRAMADPHPQVRRHGIRLAESRLDAAPEVFSKACSLAVDPEEVVRFQLALSLGACQKARIAEVLARLVQHTDNSDVVAAALVSAHSSAGSLLKEVRKDRPWRDRLTGSRVVAALVRQIKMQQRPEDVDSLVKLLRSSEKPALDSLAVGTAIALGSLESAGGSASGNDRTRTLATAQRQALHHALPLARAALADANATPSRKAAAIRVLALGDLEPIQELLADQLAQGESDVLPQVVVAAFAQRQSPMVGRILLAAWNRMSTDVRESAALLMCSRREWSAQLLDACEDEQIRYTELPATCAMTLCNHPDAAIRRRAQRLRGQNDPVDRQLAFRDYLDVVDVSGNPTDGEQLFSQHCANCHQVQGHGYAIGPNLTSMASRGPEALLYNILVPNAEIDPRYASCTVITIDGRIHTGVVAAETASSITLKGPKGEVVTVLRVDIDETFNSGTSLMPDGLEKSINKTAMADLLAYLQMSTNNSGNAKQ